jgi:cytochrome P450
MPANSTPLPPPGPVGRPPLDDLRALQRGPHEFLLRVVHVYGGMLRYPVGPLTAYVAAHPDYVKHILQDNNRNYSKDTFQYNLLGSITGNGLLTADGEFWLRQRRLAQPAFHRARIVTFAALMTGFTQTMLQRWGHIASQGQPIDVAAEMMHLALQIVGKAMFSVEIGERADTLAEATLTVLDHIVHRARTFGMIPQFLPTARNRRFRAALQTLNQAVFATIEQHRRTPDTGDLLGMMMQAKDAETDQGMTDEQLRDEVITMLIAGHETVASGLAWAWYLIGTHPDVEETLHDELDRVLGGRPPVAADLSRLIYTEMVFEEALRLYPPAWIISRKALVEDVICGYRVPAGALVVTSPYVTHRLPEFWEEPDLFQPERFTPEQTATRPRFAYYPFGGGPRLCIGNQFALIEAQLIMATVAQRYRLRPLPGHPIEVEPGVTLRPKHGLMMRLEPPNS